MQPYLRLMRTDKPIGNHHYFISEIILINHILESRYNIHKIFYDWITNNNIGYQVHGYCSGLAGGVSP